MDSTKPLLNLKTPFEVERLPHQVEAVQVSPNSHFHEANQDGKHVLIPRSWKRGLCRYQKANQGSATEFGLSSAHRNPADGSSRLMLMYFENDCQSRLVQVAWVNNTHLIASHGLPFAMRNNHLIDTAKLFASTMVRGEAVRWIGRVITTDNLTLSGFPHSPKYQDTNGSSTSNLTLQDQSV